MSIFWSHAEEWSEVIEMCLGIFGHQNGEERGIVYFLTSKVGREF